MALAGTVPVIWGIVTNHLSDAVWIALTAEGVSWLELKGSFSWRFRSLLAAAVLAVLAAITGSVTGSNLVLGCMAMFVIGFIATLLKSIGDRASGLAIVLYLLFIICNAYPVDTFAAVKHRTLLIAIGALWPLVAGLAVSGTMPVQEPFRRQIALIWRSVSALTEAVSKIDTRAGFSEMLAEVYNRERAVRTAINNSYEFHGEMTHQANQNDNRKYQLTLLRKTAALVAVNVIAMGDEMEHLSIHEQDKTLQLKIETMFGALKSATSRMTIFVMVMKPEDRMLTISQINRLRKLTTIIKEYQLPEDKREAAALARIIQLIERTIRLLDNAILRIEQMGNDTPVFKSYSLIKTSFVLKPKYLIRNIRVLFNINTFTFRYALRSAIAATAALFVSKWFDIDHGFWLPFSLMIVIQPYFGATFKKAVQRIAGTLLGVIGGSALLYLPERWYVQDSILFVTFILMVYYVRKNYTISAFFITLNLLLLLNIESDYRDGIMATRVICTVGGSLLAIASGWLVLPTWDEKWLPRHMVNAVAANYAYFTGTFCSPETSDWTKLKRQAESDNSNAFDSFNRYLQEPGKAKTEAWYGLINTNVRISRNLNNIHVEQEEKEIADTLPPTDEQMGRLWECLELFNTVMGYMHHLRPGYRYTAVTADKLANCNFALNEVQQLSLEKIILDLKTMLVDFEKKEQPIRVKAKVG